MRATHQIYCIVALLIAGYGGSACVSQCDTDGDKCSSRKITLNTSHIDKYSAAPTAGTLSIHVPGDVLSIPMMVRFLAPVAAGVTPPKFVDMPAVPTNDSGDYTASLAQNLPILYTSCAYYVNVFQDQPSYQIVDDICNYVVTVDSGDVRWDETPFVVNTAAGTLSSRGMWLSGKNSLVVEELYVQRNNQHSRYEFIKFDSDIPASAVSIDAEGWSSSSSAYFRNDQGILADYRDMSPTMSPNLFRPQLSGGSFVLNTTTPPQNYPQMNDFGVFSDLAADNGFTFLVAVSTSGDLKAWRVPSPDSITLSSRNITFGAAKNFQKVAVIQQNDGAPDFIAFDDQGKAQVFLQQSGGFAFDVDLTAARKDLETGPIAAIAVGDVDGDTFDDLAIVRQASKKTVTFYLNNGRGAFHAARARLTLDTEITAITIGPVAQTASSLGNSLAVLDSASKVSIYRNFTKDSCPFTPVPCDQSPAIVNARQNQP